MTASVNGADAPSQDGFGAAIEAYMAYLRVERQASVHTLSNYERDLRSVAEAAHRLVAKSLSRIERLAGKNPDREGDQTEQGASRRLASLARPGSRAEQRWIVAIAGPRDIAFVDTPVSEVGHELLPNSRRTRCSHRIELLGELGRDRLVS